MNCLYQDLEGTEEDIIETAYVYKTTVLVAKKRLESLGYSLSRSKLDFEQMIRIKLSDLKQCDDLSQYEKDEIQFYKKYSNFDQWINAFKIIINERPKIIYSFQERKKVHDNELVNHIMNRNQIYNNDFNYPTEDFFYFSRVILECFEDSESVMLDATDLVTGGYFLGFKNIENLFSEQTTFYESFSLGLKEIQKLIDFDINDSTSYYNMLYANIITLVETYLSDTFISTVCNFRPLMKRLLKSDPELKKRKFTLSELFDRYDNINQEIREYLVGLLYHNISKVRNLFKEVLYVEFPKDIAFLCQAIDIRHDLIHRNGKMTNGTMRSISKNDVQQLYEKTKEFILYIDSQIKNIYPDIIENDI